MKKHLSQGFDILREAGLYKEERITESSQDAVIMVKRRRVLNFRANNYLGLSNHPRPVETSKKMMDRRGFGMSSVRFICGTQDTHKELEVATSEYSKTEDTILYAACFDANGELSGALLTDEDAIVLDTLNHVPIIDGVRLCKVKHYRYASGDMAELEKCLKKIQAQRFRIICTDGVFSMDGNVAPVDEVCNLAEEYGALVMVDESHSVGVIGTTGHGANELKGTYGRADIYTGTLDKAFGGAFGGPTAGRKEIIDMLRQGSHPCFFSNSFASSIIGASLEIFEMLKEGNSLHDKSAENITYFHDKMLVAGFNIKPTQSTTCAVTLYNAPLSQKYAAKLLDEGIYATGFCYPVVPKGETRICVQLSAAHTREQLNKRTNAFTKTGKELDTPR